MYLLIYISLPFMKVDLIIVQCTTVQAMEQVMYLKDLKRDCIELAQVSLK